MSKRKRQTKTKSPYFETKKPKPEDTIEEFPLVSDIIEDDLKVLFVGINPGLMSSTRGHHYAGPTNHFWPCLSESGLVDKKVTFKDDVYMSARYRLGFTNLTARPSRKASDLTLAEQQEGIPILNEKIKQYRPRIACFVGKGIYEIYARKKCDAMGVQSSSIPWDSGKGETIIFVMPSTSGLVTSYLRPAKLKFFQELCAVAEKQDKKYPLDNSSQ